LASAILNGHPPATTLENALTIQRITDAIYESAAKNQMISWIKPGRLGCSLRV